MGLRDRSRRTQPHRRHVLGFCRRSGAASQTVFLQDWQSKLDEFLRFIDRSVLAGAGRRAGWRCTGFVVCCVAPVQRRRSSPSEPAKIRAGAERRGVMPGAMAGRDGGGNGLRVLLRAHEPAGRGVRGLGQAAFAVNPGKGRADRECPSERLTRYRRGAPCSIKGAMEVADSGRERLARGSAAEPTHRGAYADSAVNLSQS